MHLGVTLLIAVVVSTVTDLTRAAGTKPVCENPPPVRVRFLNEQDALADNLLLAIDTRHTLRFKIQYHDSHAWKDIQWHQLHAVHTSRVHVAFLSSDKSLSLHVHPEDFNGDANIATDSPVFTVLASFPSPQRYLVVFDFDVEVDKLGVSCEFSPDQVEDFATYNGSPERLMEGHQLLYVDAQLPTTPGNASPVFRPPLDTSASGGFNVNRHRQILKRSLAHDGRSTADLIEFAELDKDEERCCTDPQSCVTSSLSVRTLNNDLHDGAANQVRFVELDTCILFQVDFADADGKPLELLPYLDAKAHILMVDDHLSMGLHLHEVHNDLDGYTWDQLAAAGADDEDFECPHNDNIMPAAGQLGSSVKFFANFPHAGMWTLLVATNVAGNVVLSKFNVIASDDMAKVKEEFTCLRVQESCEASGGDCHETTAALEWVHETMDPTWAPTDSDYYFDGGDEGGHHPPLRGSSSSNKQATKTTMIVGTVAVIASFLLVVVVRFRRKAHLEGGMLELEDAPMRHAKASAVVDQNKGDFRGPQEDHDLVSSDDDDVDDMPTSRPPPMARRSSISASIGQAASAVNGAFVRSRRNSLGYFNPDQIQDTAVEEAESVMVAADEASVTLPPRPPLGRRQSLAVSVRDSVSRLTETLGRRHSERYGSVADFVEGDEAIDLA